MKNSEVPFNDELLKVSEASKIAHVSKVTIYNWIYNGILPYTKTKSGTIRIYMSELIKFLDENKK